MALTRAAMSILNPVASSKKPLPSVATVVVVGAGVPGVRVIAWATAALDGVGCGGGAATSLLFLVPLMCWYLQDSFRHSYFLTESQHITGWNMEHFRP